MTRSRLQGLGALHTRSERPPDRSRHLIDLSLHSINLTIPSSKGLELSTPTFNSLVLEGPHIAKKQRRIHIAVVLQPLFLHNNESAGSDL